LTVGILVNDDTNLMPMRDGGRDSLDQSTEFIHVRDGISRGLVSVRAVARHRVGRT
jgi:hypothetical protein